MSDDADVLVVGAGLAGLRAAQVLNRAGRHVILLDSADHVGGRLHSRNVDGFVVDEGFQLINPAYPELLATGVMTDFDLRSYKPVVRFSDGESTYELGDPRTDPRLLLTSLRHPDLTVTDALRIGAMLANLRFSSAAKIVKNPDSSTRDALRRMHVSARAIDGILAPFLRGTLLDDELATSWHYSALVLKSFTRGRPGTHPRGIAALPQALSEQLTNTTLRLGETALNVSATGVETDQARYSARVVIVATDATSAHRLTGADDPGWRAQSTWWWSLPEQRDAAQLRIDSHRRFLSSALDISSVARERAPQGRSLIGACANGVFDANCDREVRDDVARLYGVATNDVDLINRDVVPHALPVLTTPLNLHRCQVRDHVITAGDYLQTPSIQGALVSGRRGARIALARLVR
ncbi:MAG: NAD(P)-binding protein [Acidimicrobiaceae bacterium]|nr:NAD(P)-binding protein [Acidimicrobiaceae bacterium]